MPMKKKYQAGTAVNYISRAAAVKRLQLSLKTFQQLCILKGIYPRNVKHKKKANRGTVVNKVYYHLRDIKFLAHEPLINKFREYKTYIKKLVKAKGRRDRERVDVLRENKPEFSLDHLVRERYPTFNTAVRDLDDCLNLLFAFCLLPKSKSVKSTILEDCRRLTSEFLQYVIHAQCLTKVFVSIKGTYFQASIMGEKVTWLMAHQRNVGQVQNVDFATMGHFVEFYATMLSFVNFRLYKSIGLIYPPQLQNAVKASTLEDAANDITFLAFDLMRSPEVQPTVDVFSDVVDEGDDLAEKMKEGERVRSLFKEKVFWLNRETPIEPLAAVIRNCGGVVSWEAVASEKYPESFSRVDYQIVDRPLQETTMNRKYVQPQWVFDSFNYRKLMPENKYAIGARLPPHLSPFQVESMGDYIPPERIEMLKSLGKDVPDHLDAQKPDLVPKVPKKERIAKVRGETKITEGAVSDKDKEMRKMMNAAGHDKKLKEMMIPKKYKTVYKKMQFGIKRKAKENRTLANKRLRIEGQAAGDEE